MKALLAHSAIFASIKKTKERTSGAMDWRRQRRFHSVVRLRRYVAIYGAEVWHPVKLVMCVVRVQRVEDGWYLTLADYDTPASGVARLLRAVYSLPSTEQGHWIFKLHVIAPGGGKGLELEQGAEVFVAAATKMAFVEGVCYGTAFADDVYCL